MDKDSLPKLKTEGFSYTANQPEAPSKHTPSWKEKTLYLAEKIGMPIKKQSVSKASPGDADAGYKRLLIKTGACAMIAIIILAISTIDTPTTNRITETIDQAVNQNFDIDEDIGRLKFVENLDDNTQSVFSALPDSSAVYPAEGELVTSFGEGGSNGVRIEPRDSQIVSLARGTVTSVGTVGDMGYVLVLLDTGETAAYYNISPCVQVDDIVLPGQLLGDIAGSYLYLELTRGDAYIDPIFFIDQQAVSAVQ